MIIARAAYVIAAAEAKEQAKMENQLAALQRRLDDEAVARSKMEEENAALQERLLSVRLLRTSRPYTCFHRIFNFNLPFICQGKALAGGAAQNDESHQQQQHASGGANTIVVDQAILDESSQMLEFLQKENSKVKNENAKLHREVIPGSSYLMAITCALIFGRILLCVSRSQSCNEKRPTFGNQLTLLKQL